MTSANGSSHFPLHDASQRPIRSSPPRPCAPSPKHKPTAHLEKAPVWESVCNTACAASSKIRGRVVRCCARADGPRTDPGREDTTRWSSCRTRPWPGPPGASARRRELVSLAARPRPVLFSVGDIGDSAASLIRIQGGSEGLFAGHPPLPLDVVREPFLPLDHHHHRDSARQTLDIGSLVRFTKTTRREPSMARISPLVLTTLLKPFPSKRGGRGAPGTAWRRARPSSKRAENTLP
ncbi:hypothetical protein G7046_g2612 [Stylonectria norvegica]|nr:hypothetical protein G7046_g2612 [Stylonectria norvegica]